MKNSKIIENIFQYYNQKNYDFNTDSLGIDDIKKIKQLVKEKRADYNSAPIGKNIFNFIQAQEPSISFEKIALKNNIDGVLYIPSSTSDKAYIILNCSIPLVNQIFAAAHEYYHYIKDYETIRKKPYICKLQSLKDINEKKASRFSAELLLPSYALNADINYLIEQNNWNISTIDMYKFIYICFYLTIKYQLPIKAVMYRLKEEGYLKNQIDNYLSNYEMVKRVLLQTNNIKSQILELYNNKNDYIDYNNTINNMEQAYKKGLVSTEEILSDAKTLGIDSSILTFLYEDSNSDNDDDDTSDEEYLNNLNINELINNLKEGD